MVIVGMSAAYEVTSGHGHEHRSSSRCRSVAGSDASAACSTGALSPIIALIIYGINADAVGGGLILRLARREPRGWRDDGYAHGPVSRGSDLRSDPLDHGAQRVGSLNADGGQRYSRPTVKIRNLKPGQGLKAF